MKEIKLQAWNEFEAALRAETELNNVLVRNFALITFDDIFTDPIEIDTLAVVRSTGTDRRENASMWNAPGFDYDHELKPAGRKPNEIIYAFLVDLTQKPYLVSVGDGNGNASFQVLDLTDHLTEHDGIIVYDPDKLFRAAPNEYWFLFDPLEAALLLFTLSSNSEDADGEEDSPTSM